MAYSELKNWLAADKVLENEPLKNHTTFHIGGPADCLVLPATPDDVALTLRYSRDRNAPLFFFGLGSNLLVGDKGIRGITIKMGGRFTGWEIRKNVLEARAGTALNICAEAAARNALGGMEFAEGIPGSVAGAVFMNAGAYGREMKDVVEEAEAVDGDGNRKIYTKEEMDFSYRRSCFTASGDLILRVKIRLYNENPRMIRERMKELAQLRQNRQPLGYPSAGSVFRRPAGYFTGKLLEEMGLKGYRVGGAQVSEKHAGFIINTGGATAADVRKLIADIKAKVMEERGVELETEIKMAGEF
ncbi:MAG: UDP-N-acetylmuramate dehydrogenase [Syntrophomonadaceae bacterium]|jgi:UDP-N-acetylmuramate dehydrogenase|nr:UDP-N-acetylmuramate dehydrogenase [Syntrophomonadaceae bacterium]